MDQASKRIVAIGDVVGKPGRNALAGILPAMIERDSVDFVMVNAENVAGGSGITEKLFREVLAVGADAVTSGDHIWKKQKIDVLLNREKRLLRPHNFSPRAAGTGVSIIPSKSGFPVAVINLMGRVYMTPVIDDPFTAADEALKAINGKTRVIIVDMHAETTSEKQALAHYLDGRVSAVFGTHTHVQTADETILPKGTAFICDLGMTGPHDSILGRKVENVLHRYLTHMYERFDVAEDGLRVCGAVVDVDPHSGRALSIRRINLPVDSPPKKGFGGESGLTGDAD